MRFRLRVEMRSISSRVRIGALGEQALVGALVVQVGLHFLPPQDVFQALQALVGENADFVRQVLLQLGDLRGFDGLGALVFLLPLREKIFTSTMTPSMPGGQ